jgi:hypothetical protein
MQQVGNVGLLFQPLAIRISFCPLLDLVRLQSFESADEKGRTVEHVGSLWEGGMLRDGLNQVVLGMTQKKFVVGGDLGEGQPRRIAMIVQVLQQFTDPSAMVVMLYR